MIDSYPVPHDIDASIPSPARMYDYYLGGKDNFPADREAADQALTAAPYGRQLAVTNRRFLVRAVKYLARNGIWQFIDLGTGIPTSPSVHEAARQINPGARVAYVDNDPMVGAHNRALLENRGSGIAAIDGDIRSPQDFMTDPALNKVINSGRPVGILFVAVLHFITNAEDPHRAVAAWKEHMPSGSYLVISHLTSDGAEPEVIAHIEEAYKAASAPVVFRSREEIGGLFSGFELVRPGLTEISAWRGNGRTAADPPTLRFLGGVGRKP